MDRYEELKQYISSKILEYQNKLEEIKREMVITDTADVNALRLLEMRFQDYNNHLLYAKNKEIYLKTDEQKVRTMLEGFCDNDSHVSVSWIYHSILKVPGYSYMYSVGDKYFKTLEEAKEYSISLGEKENWLSDAYVWL